MSYKTLLLHVEPTLESDLRLKMSVQLARDFSATLIGVGGCIPAYLDHGFIANEDGPLLQKVEDQERLDLDQAAARFRELTAELEHPALWRSGGDYPDRVVAGCAAGADLVVASASRGPRASTIDAGELALRAGVPVLTLPTDLAGLRRKHILVAWKNRRESRRAVGDALPLLRDAEQVTVLQIQDDAAADDMWDGLQGVVDRLRRHGVSATTETMASGSCTADDIISFAESRLFDLIVSGAYGHSRLREWSFGGVTRGLLEQSTLPILFSH